MTRATVFGLDVWVEDPLPYLEGARSPHTGRVLDVLIDRRDVGPDWPIEAELISAQQEPDGTLAICIHAHEEAGYQLSGSRYGRHVLSPDGRRLRCVPDGTAEDDWQRFMIGQVLPFAAALNGLEVFHASAVTVNGGALALLGPSGAGKTSLALALCRRGARFLADDVLALECCNGELLAHPGTPVAGLAHAEFACLAGRTTPLETLAVNERERLVRVPISRGPAPLSALVFLDRASDGPDAPRFTMVPDPRMLLASTFNFVLDNPQRLESLLDVCALAAARPVVRVSFGLHVGSSQLAAAVTDWFEGVH